MAGLAAGVGGSNVRFRLKEQTLLDYIQTFPIPEALLPPRLRALLAPVDLTPDHRVDVTVRHEVDPHGPDQEYTHMLMAVVHDIAGLKLQDIDQTGSGVVYSSQPDVDTQGGIRNFNPTVSGHDYIVSSNGGNSFSGFQLSDKVWIALGLTPRTIGATHQLLTYDDLSAPEFGIAEGEVSTEYHYTAKRNVRWTMSNEYLRRYLWMRDAHGVRIFFYQKLFVDEPQLRNLMNGQRHALIKPAGGWYELDIREVPGGLLVQLWAIVAAVEPQQCPLQTGNGLQWPGTSGLMTHQRANALVNFTPIYLNDRFLERYEQNSLYDTMPVFIPNAWHCGPSYKGQWGFTGFQRVGRNLIRASLRDVYKGVPDREILRAFADAIPTAKIAGYDLTEEHIVSKTSRLAEALLTLGDNLEEVARSLGMPDVSTDIVKLSRSRIVADQWRDYPELSKLAQVAPLDMTEQAFLARCKSIHEFWQRIPNGFIKTLLERNGQQRNDIKSFGSAKLLQALSNTLERLNAAGERLDTFAGSSDVLDLNRRNSNVAALFKTNDLRIADAHNAGGVLVHLDEMGFDIAGLNNGYGRALDYVFDQVIDTFNHVNGQLGDLISR
jgi:hypothetical protein